MLVIRDSQLRAFKAAADSRFVAKAIPYLQEDFPEELAEMGAEGAHSFALYGLHRSACYGITTEANVLAYLQVAVLLGRDFDVDDDLPWAAMILGDSSRADEDLKIELLLQAVSDHFAE